MNYAVGSLVRTRGREWVVLPESRDPVLVVRPLGGTEEEVTGIHLGLEQVESAEFGLPDPSQIGDYRSCKLLRDAVRLGFRSGAGPFRSFARIAVEPRPYQLVPLLMALKLDPVRLLIADDVGIGKTIEACLAAKELLDRGEVNRLTVLCPPHLAPQWQAELRDKFHIDAELVLSSTARKLESNCLFGQSVFDVYPFTIVSTDFIKSEQRREEFVHRCPELVIIDEAHTCAYAGVGRGGRHQRHQLVKRLVKRDDRHIIFVTATPHSGNEDAFRSLLAFLQPEFANLPSDLSGPQNEHHRRTLAAHFVQRRRADIQRYLQTDTPFPQREEPQEEPNYSLSPDYKKLLDRVLKYARETVKEGHGGRHRQRVRWWSALALLRSMASSPAAAAATLRSRAITADTQTEEEADEIGREAILDLEDEEISERLDTTPGCDIDALDSGDTENRRRLLAMAREADALQGDKDEKLKTAVKIVDGLLKEGFRPILFCRFIPTAEYVAEELRRRLSQKAEVAAITGILPPTEREERIRELGQHPKPVLVCTDCLSEGINLQDWFDAVVHYDLSWNPTRHEQRAGRVDRFGQPKEKVRVLTYYGIDNQIDGIVLDVLLRKHKTIRSSLGYSVPVPVNSDQVIEAIFEGMLLREDAGTAQAYLPGFDEYFKPQKEALHAEWDRARDKEKRSRTMFAQETIKVDEVAAELKAVRSAIGSSTDVAEFTQKALQAHKAVVSKNGVVRFDLREVPRAVREAIGVSTDEFRARFDRTGSDDSIYLTRTHPIVDGLAGYVMDTSLDPLGEGVARRAGVIRTKQVNHRTTVLLVRFRHHIVTRRGTEEKPLLAEDCRILAFTGSPSNATWLPEDRAEEMLRAEPSANITLEQATEFVSRVIEGFGNIEPYLIEAAQRYGKELLDSHVRVRKAAQAKGVRYEVEPKLPPDVMGIYVYLPAA